MLACIQASQREPTLRTGTFNKIRGRPRNVLNLPHVYGGESESCHRHARSHGNLHDRRIEFQILYPAHPNRYLRRRSPPKSGFSIGNLHFFSSYRESRFTVTRADLWIFSSIHIDSFFLKFRMPKKILPMQILIQITFFYTKYISKFLKVTFIPRKIL